MGKAAKTILDGLNAARVPSAAQKRAKDLIDQAHDWDDVQANEVGAVVSYVAPTSTGRWLLARLDADADSVFEIARSQQKDGTSKLYRLLLAHRRPLFERIVSQRVPKKDSDRSFLAEVMLNADARHFEKQAVRLVTGLTTPVPAVFSARNLERHFPGKYRDEMKELLLAAITGKNAAFLFEDKARGSRDVAYEMAWLMLKDDAFEIWNAYHEENDARRLNFYEAIEKQAKAKALPWLLDGLVYKWDSRTEYGMVTHAKYVARMIEILKPYDLAPHRGRIEKAFARNTDKKIRELVDGLFTTKRAGMPAKKPAPVDARRGYRFDIYAASVVTAALAAAKKQRKQLPSPIESVKLGGHQGDVQLNSLTIEGVGEPLTLLLKVAKNRVPAHVDFDDGALLAQFAKRHGLEAGTDEVPSWGDLYKLPWCVLLHEQIVAVRAIAAGLKKLGFKIAKRCKVGVGEDDNFWESAESFARMSREEIAALPRDQQAGFAALCFESAKKQKWLSKP